MCIYLFSQTMNSRRFRMCSPQGWLRECRDGRAGARAAAGAVRRRRGEVPTRVLRLGAGLRVRVREWVPRAAVAPAARRHRVRRVPAARRAGWQGATHHGVARGLVRQSGARAVPFRAIFLLRYVRFPSGAFADGFDYDESTLV